MDSSINVIEEVVELVVEPVVKSIVETVVEYIVEPVVEHVIEPLVETKVDHVVEPVVDHVVEPVVDHVVEPVVDHVVEPVVEHVVEPVAEPVAEPIAEPVIEPMVDPVVEDKFVVKSEELTFQKKFETFLQQNQEQLNNFNITLNPEIQQYFLQFCKENSNFFPEIENILKAIILDNAINSKDIPEFLKLVIKVYDIIKNKKKIPNVEPYEIIEVMLHILIVSYLEKENKNNYDKELANKMTEQIMNIIKVSIELLKLPIIKNATKGCFGFLKHM